ncbi:glucose-6-phosphate isomerase [Methanocorpusculum sp. GPch4]|jgi:glucose-6-phosphate isomerase|uniref:glucose-6-phosphate isomerase n=1 Tax=Methanocorpusculum sp. GPch4 TaxID=2527877 RepID=UPI001432C819|nr:glucose-6-phosphate isomerase [Methanocorpusculum sp. GPch4]
MTEVQTRNWQRFQELFYEDPGTGLALDVSRMNLDEDFLGQMEEPMQRALASMEELEKGALANPDENRMVGHYWLRAPELAPTPEITEEIRSTLTRIRHFASLVHDGRLRPERAERFTRILSIGIGGSALGPQFVASALASPDDPMQIHFFDNTDPDGMDRVLDEIGGDLHRTLTVVISKSGGTKETRNGMLEAQNAYDRAGLRFGLHAVAVTGAGSQLDRYAQVHGWLERFPMWDWVGGRTSELSAVGLLPAALQGFQVEAILEGAAAADRLTRNRDIRQNPAALLALSWHRATHGRGEKDMVVLPYCDRLELFSRYLQQLVMESLGKETDLEGRTVHQGIAVYGNKGSTDQHAYVQQLRDGIDNFFATFLVVLKNRERSSMEVEDGITTGDFLSGFWQGTREALSEKGRLSLTVTIPEVNPFTLGMLVALYERAVGLYASLVGINAYHQPGVEAGKLAAGAVLALQQEMVTLLQAAKSPMTCEEMARALGHPEQVETVFHVARHLAANAREGVVAEGQGLGARYAIDPRRA